MTNSVHSARWINQMEESDLFDIYIFPSFPTIDVHADLIKYKVQIPLKKYFIFLKLLGLKSNLSQLYYAFFEIIKRYFPIFFQKQLIKYCQKIKPDLVHTLETQNAGYLFSNIRNKSKYLQNLKWWHTNWGSDIQIFGKMKEHQNLIKAVLSQANFYSCECHRDIELAKNFGFKGEFMPVYPNSGGFKMKIIEQMRSSTIKTSERKYILIKGYNGWAGRSLVAIRAIGRCADILTNYKILLFSVNQKAIDVQIAVALLQEEFGLDIEILPPNLQHNKILDYHGMSRISIGLSIGDGISTSSLEAMAMGSFPIQSCSSCVNEWILNGKTGIIVPPEDPEMVESAIRIALKDNNLVDMANIKNFSTIKSNADYFKLKELTLNSYSRILIHN